MKHNEKRVPHYNLKLIKELIQQRKYLIRKIAIENAYVKLQIVSDESVVIQFKRK